ncbi:MAG: response regulator [Pseudomonadota bacterium]
MDVLIVETNAELAGVWARSLQRSEATVRIAKGEETAIRALEVQAFDVIILNLGMQDGSALAVADFAGFRHPDAKVVFVTSSTFFSDGSIFNHASNACAYLKDNTPPEDLAAIVEHYGRA